MIDLPEIKRKRKVKARKTPYRKPEAVKDLERMANAEAIRLHPTCPHLAPRTYRDDTANELTKCVVDYIKFNNGFASRINNQGTFNRRLNRFIPNTSKKGLADIMATVRGKSLHIEVKTGRDKQSEHQKRIEAEVNRSGGYYFLCKDFESFRDWFDFLIVK